MSRKEGCMSQVLPEAGRNLKGITCAAALQLMFSASVPAAAGTILDLSMGGRGVVAIGVGERHPRLHGASIRVHELTYGASSFRMLWGHLTFSGGGFASSNGSSYFWGPGGSLSVVGCIDLNHDGKFDKGDFRGTLMTGSFLNAELVDRNGKEILEARIVDQLNTQLAALLHLNNTSHTGELELTLAQLSHDRWWVHDGVQGGYLQDYGSVPEPSSILLLGASL